MRCQCLATKVIVCATHQKKKNKKKKQNFKLKLSVVSALSSCSSLCVCLGNFGGLSKKKRLKSNKASVLQLWGRQTCREMYGSAPSPAPQEMLCTSHFLFGATCVPVESVLADDRLINHVVSICGEESSVIRWMCSGALATDWSGSKGFFPRGCLCRCN